MNTVKNPIVRQIYILAYNRLGGEVLEEKCFFNLPMTLVIKYAWYFKYTHALLQIKYPKGHIETFHKNVSAEGRDLERINLARKKVKITTCKRMISKFSNLLTVKEEEFKKTLFPDFNDEKYLYLKERIKDYQIKLKNAENE